MKLLQAEYRKTFDYLKGIRRTLFLVTGAFFLTAALSWVYFMTAGRESMTALMQSLLNSLMDQGLLDADGGLLAGGIILHNLRAMVVGVAMGLVPVIFLPLLSLLINAVVIGLTGAFTLSSGIPMGTFLAAIVPHGILEFPAIFISLGLGMQLCLFLTRKLIRSPKSGAFMDTALELLRTFVLVIFPLVAAAGLVEAYITPLIAGLALS